MSLDLGIGQLFGSTISTAGNIAATEMTNQANRDIADSVNKTNLQLAENQNSWNVQQWNRQNEYNTPAAQASRLRAAGLSAAGAAGAVSGNEAGPLQSADLANQQIGEPMHSPDLSSLSGLNVIGIARQLAALKKERAEASMTEKEDEVKSDMLLTNLDVMKANYARLKQDFTYKAYEMPYSLSQMQYNAKLAGYKAQAAAHEPESAKLDNELKKQNLKQLRQTFDFLEHKNAEDLKLLDISIKEKLQNIRSSVRQMQHLDAVDSNLQAQNENIGKQGELLDKQVQGAETDNDRKKIEKDISAIEYELKRFGMPENMAQRVSVMLSTGKLKPDEVLQSFERLSSYFRTGQESLLNDPTTRRFYQWYVNPSEGDVIKSYGAVTKEAFGIAENLNKVGSDLDKALGLP